jgi:hypothetical protein
MTDEELRLECLKIAAITIGGSAIKGFGDLQDEKPLMENEADRFFRYVRNISSEKDEAQ